MSAIPSDLRPATCASMARIYRRRRPERTVLYRLVHQHLETWLARSREADPVCLDFRLLARVRRFPLRAHVRGADFEDQPLRIAFTQLESPITALRFEVAAEKIRGIGSELETRRCVLSHRERLASDGQERECATRAQETLGRRRFSCARSDL